MEKGYSIDEGFNFSKAQGYLTRFFNNSVDFNQSLERELFKTHHQFRGLTKSSNGIILFDINGLDTDISC